jgi:hypothetical protein
MENLMGKSTAIMLILLAFGPNKGEPVSKIAEQMPPKAEKQIRSPSPAPAAGQKSLARAPSSTVVPASPPPAQLKQQKSPPESSQTDLDEPPIAANR